MKMREEYISSDKCQIDPSVGSSQGAFYVEGLSVHRLRSQVHQCSLCTATPNPLWFGQCERAKKPRSVYPHRSPLPGVPFCASAHDGKQELASPRPLTAYSDPTFHQDVRRPKFNVPSVAGTFWALSGGNPGVEPSTSGAEKVPASLSVSVHSPKVINALPPRAGFARGTGGGIVSRRRAFTCQKPDNRP